MSLKSWLIEKGGTFMLSKAFNALKGCKTYILASIGAIVAIVGHFWGPISVGGVSLPQVSLDDMWKAIWAVASLASLRHGISTSSDPTK